MSSEGSGASASGAEARCGRSAGYHTFTSAQPGTGAPAQAGSAPPPSAPPPATPPSSDAPKHPAKTPAGLLHNLGCNDPDSATQWNFRTLNLGTLKSTRHRDGPERWQHEIWQAFKTADLANLASPELKAALADTLHNGGRVIIVQQRAEQRRSHETMQRPVNRKLARRVNLVFHEITISLPVFDPSKPGEVRAFCERHKLAHAAVIEAVKGNNRGLHIQLDSPFRTEFRRLFDVVADRAEARLEKLQERFKAIELRSWKDKNTAERAAIVEDRRAAIEAVKKIECQAATIITIDAGFEGDDVPPRSYPMATIAMLFDTMEDAVCFKRITDDVAFEAQFDISQNSLQVFAGYAERMVCTGPPDSDGWRPMERVHGSEWINVVDEWRNETAPGESCARAISKFWHGSPMRAGKLLKKVGGVE